MYHAAHSIAFERNLSMETILNLVLLLIIAFVLWASLILAIRLFVIFFKMIFLISALIFYWSR